MARQKIQVSIKARRIVGSLVGVALGDALGTTNEFKHRGSFTPVWDIEGGGPFNLKPGQWTDDTSMTLCLAESLLAHQGFNAQDQMSRYLKWYREGYWSCRDTCIDIGMQTAQELRRFESSGEPFSDNTDARRSPNGSLMRVAPVSLFFHADFDAAVHFSGESSKTTHASVLCVDACRYLGALIWEAINGAIKDDLLSANTPNLESLAAQHSFDPLIAEIMDGSYMTKTPSQIHSSGYVVHSLEAALWCFWKSHSFRHGALLAANLGLDTDTVAAIYGALAGAYYGVTERDSRRVLNIAYLSIGDRDDVSEEPAYHPRAFPDPTDMRFERVIAEAEAECLHLEPEQRQVPTEWIDLLWRRADIIRIGRGLAGEPGVA